MKNNTSKRDKRQYIKKLAGKYPYFTQFPDLIRELGLSKHPLLVLPYLMSLVNSTRNYTCWPSVKTICKNCAISSRNTVHKALKELEEAGLITINHKGRNNIYTIAEEMYLPMKKANKKDKEISELEATRPHSEHIEREEEEVLQIAAHSEHIRPHSELRPDHIVDTNNNNRTKLIKNTNSPVSPLLTAKEGFVQKENTSAKGKTTSLAEANRYYQSLTERGKDAFDIGEQKLLRPDESNSMAIERVLRCRYFEELLEIHAARRGGEPVFTVPAEFQPESREVVEEGIRRGGSLRSAVQQASAKR